MARFFSFLIAVLLGTATVGAFASGRYLLGAVELILTAIFAWRSAQRG